MEFNSGLHQFQRTTQSSFSSAQSQPQHAAQLIYAHPSAAQPPPPDYPPPPPPSSVRPMSQARSWLSNASARFWPSLQKRHTTLPINGHGQQSSALDTTDPTMARPSTAAPRSVTMFPSKEPPAQANVYPQPIPRPGSSTMPVSDTPMDVRPTSWCQKYEALDYGSMDTENQEYSQDLMQTDEDIVDLRQPHFSLFDSDGMQASIAADSKRLSESTYSLSSIGALGDLTFDDMSYASDCDAWSTLDVPPTGQSLLSPLTSPRNPHYESVIRSGSRSRASPLPSTSFRSSPYSMDTTRAKRWSTGTCAPSANGNSSHTVSNASQRYSSYIPRVNPHSSPAYPAATLGGFSRPPSGSFQRPPSGSFQRPPSGTFYPQPPILQSNSHLVEDEINDPFVELETPRPVPSQGSQGLFRLLQSNDHQAGCTTHYADLSDPPDLYSSVREPPSDPPEEDLHPDDPNLTPHEQDLRFPGDLYTPRWVRGHGNKREGWCGLCKPGRWLVLKNSAFWYDKSFTHGVSAATGAAFQGPRDQRRTEANVEVWEGLCGSCGDWVNLVSTKKKGTTWFRHAYKCHSHPKVKDTAKRRRETSQSVRARATSLASNPSALPNSATATIAEHPPLKRSASSMSFASSSSIPPSLPAPSDPAPPLPALAPLHIQQHRQSFHEQFQQQHADQQYEQFQQDPYQQQQVQQAFQPNPFFPAQSTPMTQHDGLPLKAETPLNTLANMI